MICAEIHSDDHKPAASFDATPYFEQATLQDIEELADCGFGGDYPADGVAEFMSDKDSKIAKVFERVEGGHPMPFSDDKVGLECHIVEADVAAWVRANKPPDWFTKVWGSDYANRAVMAQEVYNAVAQAAESLEHDDMLGPDLAYLLGAILNNTGCEWPADRAIVRALREKFPNDQFVFHFVTVVGAEASEEADHPLITGPADDHAGSRAS